MKKKTLDDFLPSKKSDYTKKFENSDIQTKINKDFYKIRRINNTKKNMKDYKSLNLMIKEGDVNKLINLKIKNYKKLSQKKEKLIIKQNLKILIDEIKHYYLINEKTLFIKNVEKLICN